MNLPLKSFLHLIIAVLLLIAVAGEKHLNDFIQYLTAFRILEAGGNPYDPAQIFEAQKQLENIDSPIMFWLPPWSLVILYPILTINPLFSVLIWRCFSIVSLIITSWFALRNEGVPKNKLFEYSLLSVCFFLPTWSNIFYGQIGSVLGIGAVLLYVGLCKKNSLLISLGAALLSIKPHLIYLLSLFIFLDSYRAKTLRPIVAFAAGIGMMMLLSEIFFPGSNALWIRTFGFSEEGNGVVSRNEWKTATLTYVYRYFLINFFPSSGITLHSLVVIPAIATLVSLVIMFLRDKPLSWKVSFPIILGISVAISPYGWLFDFCIFLPLQIVIIRDVLLSPSHLRVKFGILFVAFHLVSFIQSLFFAKSQHEFFWIPIGMVALVGFMSLKNYGGQQNREPGHQYH